jgi:hypothetical protein
MTDVDITNITQNTPVNEARSFSDVSWVTAVNKIFNERTFNQIFV